MNVEEKIRALTASGWSLRITVDFDGEADVFGHRGDCNCPRPYEYDPLDGHGYSEFDTDSSAVKGLDEALDLAAGLAAAIVPGAKRAT